MRIPPFRSVALLPILLATLACGSGANPTAEPRTAVPTQTATPTPGPTVVPTQAPTPSPAVAVDETLLDLLPIQVGGIALVSDPDTAASIARDPSLAIAVTAIAVAIAIAPGTSNGDDIAIVSVLQLKDGIVQEAFFGAYRQSFDAAACARAGGLDGTTEADIGDHHAFVGACANGASTYHVYLEPSNVVVSVTSVGETRLGEQVIAGLREPASGE